MSGAGSPELENSKPDHVRAEEDSPLANKTAPGVQPDETDAAGKAEADPLESLKLECAELRDKNLRALADLRNFQQRSQREKQEVIRYAEADFAREMLIVLGDLERTLESARSAPQSESVVEGVQIVYDNFVKVLQNRHIEAIEALGEPFDPTYHEAMMRRASDEHPAGTIVQQIARGYKMHDRVLRPSRVIVSSGPSEAPKNSPANDEES